MRKNSRGIFFLFLACTFFLRVSAQGTIQFSEAGGAYSLAGQKASSKLTFLYFTNPGCGPCKMMEKDIFTRPLVYQLYNASFLPVKVNCTEANKQALRLQEKYKVAAFPTLLFVDATGKVVHKSVGYAGENKLLQLARQALGTDNFAAWNKQLEAGDVKAEAVLKLLEVEEKPEVYLEQGYQCRAQQILDKYFAAILAADYTKDINWHLVERFVADPHSAIFQYVVEHQQEFSKEFGAEHVNRKLFNTYLATTYGNTSTDRYRKAIKEIEISSVPQAKLVVEYRRLQELFYTAKKEQKWQAFVEQSSPFVEQYYYLLDTHLLNTWVSELAKANPTNKSILSSLNKWLAQVTANSYLDDYDILVTHANVQFKLGDKANARKNQQAAITLARQQDTDSAEIAEMEKQLRRYQ